MLLTGIVKPCPQVTLVRQPCGVRCAVLRFEQACAVNPGCWPGVFLIALVTLVRTGWCLPGLSCAHRLVQE